MRLLLVEDHEEIWDFLSRRLQRRGYEVSVATDGQAGVDQARALQPGVMLLDMNLPVMDGWSVARLAEGGPGDGTHRHHRADRACDVRRPGKGAGGRVR